MSGKLHPGAHADFYAPPTNCPGSPRMGKLENGEMPRKLNMQLVENSGQHVTRSKPSRNQRTSYPRLKQTRVGKRSTNKKRTS